MNGLPTFGRFRIRRTIDRLQIVYLVLVLTQSTALLLYEGRVASGAIVPTLGPATSLVGPGLSVVVGVHFFQQRRLSRLVDMTVVALTYVVTCTSFAIVYATAAARALHAFTLAASLFGPSAPQTATGEPSHGA